MHPPSAQTSPHHKTPPLSPLLHTPHTTTQPPMPLKPPPPPLPPPPTLRCLPPTHPSVPSPDHGTGQTLIDEETPDSAQQANYQRALLELQTHLQASTRHPPSPTTDQATTDSDPPTPLSLNRPHQQTQTPPARALPRRRPRQLTDGASDRTHSPPPHQAKSLDGKNSTTTKPNSTYTPWPATSPRTSTQARSM